MKQPLTLAQNSDSEERKMLYKKSAVHLMLVLLLSFSLLWPPSSTTNTHLTVKERNEVIHRNLGGGKPPSCPPHALVCHAKSNFAPPRDHGK
ncbi:hypothetical protein Goshw_010296 [Gossypium schwendimanii]|uniref:Uncharacterized protein n=1 Tax=Gossypium schwendimanii TaxID=34291 RepID=A0A7J9MH46_GOSSC|nr:hypothetical protein [Gossypium schwendimanii]